MAVPPWTQPGYPAHRSLPPPKKIHTKHWSLLLTLPTEFKLQVIREGFFFFNLLPIPHSMWDLSSLTRNQTCAPYIGSVVLWTTREVPEKFLIRVSIALPSGRLSPDETPIPSHVCLGKAVSCSCCFRGPGRHLRSCQWSRRPRISSGKPLTCLEHLGEIPHLALHLGMGWP